MSIEKDFLNAKREFGSKVKTLRTNKCLSQLDLAALCNYEKSTISRIENGRTNITLKTAINLSNSLDVELKDLFDFK